MAASETWTNPEVCPFCNTTLTSPGEGFMNHIETNDGCRSHYEDWRTNITDDMTGGWSG